jgi:hypothetical protein
LQKSFISNASHRKPSSPSQYGHLTRTFAVSPWNEQQQLACAATLI